jgi:hypothetical protein
MNQEQFDRLPGLLSRSQFCGATGITVDVLRKMKDAKLVRAYKPYAGARKAKYYKADAARIAGFKF